MSDQYTPPPAALTLVRRLALRMAASPWELFGWLGTVAFGLGWVGILYLVFSTSDENPAVFVGAGTTEAKIYFLVTTGPMVTIAGGILWAIAALTWRRSTQR